MADPPVTFSFATWTGSYAEFSNCTPAQGQSWFTRASFICANDACNPLVCTPGMLDTALYLLTCHIGWMNAPRDASGNPASAGAPPSSLVGRINSASEGSVSVGAEWNGSGSPSEAWFLQTRYGAEYLQLTAGQRVARYVAQPTVIPENFFPYVGGPRRW